MPTPTTSAQYQLPEAVRLDYLKAMGVVSWLPVVGDIGAPGPCWQALPRSMIEEMEAEVEKPIATLAAPNELASEPPLSSRNAQALTHLLTQSLTQTLEPEKPNIPLAPSNQPPSKQTQVAPAATVYSSEQVEPIHLNLSWYLSGVLVINEIPLQGDAAMSNSLTQLQTAIVNSLALGKKEVMPQTQAAYYWPLVPGPHGDKSRTGGEQALVYQLGKMLTKKQTSRVLLMGQRSLELLPYSDNVEPLDFGSIILNPVFGNAQILLTHSLHQLLKVPSYKAETWRHLQPMLGTHT